MVWIDITDPNSSNVAERISIAVGSLSSLIFNTVVSRCSCGRIQFACGLTPPSGLSMTDLQHVRSDDTLSVSDMLKQCEYLDVHCDFLAAFRSNIGPDRVCAKFMRVEVYNFVS